MTLIEHDIHELASLSSGQLNLHCPFSQPIKVKGQIHDSALIDDITKYFIGRNSNEPYSLEIGVDEVGRGPLYGSVVVSAVILPTIWSGEIEQSPLQNTPLSMLTDSKKLTEAKRERLFSPLKQKALAYVVVEIPASVIDSINILQATMLGMRLSSEQLICQVSNVLQESVVAEKVQCLHHDILNSKAWVLEDITRNIEFKLLIDGNKIPELDWNLLAEHGAANDAGSKEGYKVTSEAWVKGDARHTAIAAASVLAKVSRDRQVIQDGIANPGYGLEGHKGYPTKAHLEAINKLGVLPQHRRSFRPVQEALNQCSIVKSTTLQSSTFE